MKEQLDLGSYLAQQASGGVKESTGGFTVAHLKARRKLAKFALPRRSAWVSKLVQAAVGWRIGTLLIKQSSKETQFFFHSDRLDFLPSEDDIVGTILSDQVVARTPLENLCLALRALVEQAQLSFILVAEDGVTAPQPIYAGYYYIRLTEEARLTKRYARGPGITLTVYHVPAGEDDTFTFHLGLNPYGTDIVRELDTYAYTSPVPIVVDGRHVEGLLEHGIGSPRREYPLVLSGLTEVKGSPDRLPLPPSFEEKVMSFLTHPRRARRGYGGRREFAAAFRLSFHLPANPDAELEPRENHCRLHWVRDGVVTQSHDLRLKTRALGLRIYANAAGLSTDLTGFQLVEDAGRFKREAELYRGLGRAMQRLRDERVDFFRADLDSLSDRDEELDEELQRRSRVKLLLKGSGAGLLLSLLNPAVGVTATLGSVAVAFGSKLLAREPEWLLTYRNSLHQSIESDLELLAVALGEFAQASQKR